VLQAAQYDLSLESKRKSVKSKTGKWGVQLLAYLQFYN